MWAGGRTGDGKPKIVGKDIKAEVKLKAAKGKRGKAARLNSVPDITWGSGRQIYGAFYKIHCPLYQWVTVLK